MRRPILPLAGLAALALLAGAAAPAEARRALDPPSIDTDVTRGGRVPDRVVERFDALPRAPRARVAASGEYQTQDGYTISVVVSPSYVSDTAAVQDYVDFLGSLPHGSELGRLQVFIATPAEISSVCGPEAAACYSSEGDAMLVPGEQPPGTALSVELIVAHEYGHHVANFRNNSPWTAGTWGPKFWASYERVCLGVLQGRYFPGNQGSRYASNPGEAWAETYAHLVYPDLSWDYDPTLEPNASAFAAARRDVTEPWTGRRTTRFSGSLKASRKTRSFNVRLTLDGALSLRLSGPSDANYDLAAYVNGEREGSTSASGARDRLEFKTACRSRSTEIVKVRVMRRSGSGSFTLTAKYAG